MSYFRKINCENKAYWLGFILADGSVFWNSNSGNYGLCIGLQERDAYHIKRLEVEMGGNRDPEFNKEKKSARITWYSKELADDLIKHGIYARKSYDENTQVPNIPKKYTKDFWRGFFDGDGMITTKHSKIKPYLIPQYYFSLCGSKPILEAFQKWGKENANMRPQKIGKAKNQFGESRTYVFYMGGNRQVHAVLNALYSKSTIHLDRKYKFYGDLVSQNSNCSNKSEMRYK